MHLGNLLIKISVGPVGPQNRTNRFREMVIFEVMWSRETWEIDGCQACLVETFLDPFAGHALGRANACRPATLFRLAAVEVSGFLSVKAAQPSL